MKLKKFSFLLSATAATVAVPLVAVSCGKTATTEVTAQGELDKITAVAFTGTDQANTSVSDVTNEQLKLKAGEADYKAPTGSDVKVAFEITTRLAVDGSLKVKVSVQKGAETPLTKELDLTGFKAEPAVQNVTQAEVDAEAAKITAVEYNGTEASAKENVLPSQVDVAKLVAKAGKEVYAHPIGGSWATEFVKTADDDAAGTLKVKVKVTSGTLFAESKEVALDGFLTSDQKAVNDAKAAITSADYDDKASVLPSEATDLNKFSVTQAPAPDAGITVTYGIVANSQNNDAGTLKVKATLTKGGKTAVTDELEVSGFLTSDQKAVNDAKAAITSADYTDKASVLPSEATDLNKFSVTQAPAPDAGITVTYGIVANSQNNDAGTLKVKVKVTSGTLFAESKEVALDGFLTSDQKAVNDAKAAITSADYDDKASVLPSEATDLNKFSVTQAPAPDAGITVTYGIVANSQNNDAGTLKVKATLTKGGKTAVTDELEVSGFLTSDQKAVNDAKAAITSADYTDKASVLPSEATDLNKFSVTQAPAPDAGITVTYGIVANSQNNDAGTLKVKATLTKGGKTAVTDELEVSGFLTSDQKAVNDAKAAITSADYTDKASVLPSEATDLNKFSVTQAPAPDAGITVTYGIVANSQNNDAGTLKVKATLTKGGKTAVTDELEVSGFLTSDQKAVNDAKAAITSADYTDKASVLPSEATDLNKFSVTQAPAPDAGITVTYGIVANSQNNDAGTLKVKVKVTSGTLFAESKEVALDGFLTSDQKAVNDAKAAITSADYDDKASVLPSEATDLNKFSVTQAPAPDAGITVTYGIVANSQNNDAGTLKVKATLTKGGKTAVTDELEVSGFLTSDQKAVNDAKAAITSADYTDKASVLPSEATDLNKFSVTQAPAPDAGITVTYGIVANSQNNDAGTLKVKATLTKGGKTAVTDELEVSGFLTSDQKAVNDAKAAITSADYTDKASVLPSEATDLNKFSVTQAPAPDAGITVTYEIVASSQDNATGTLKVKATLTKGGKTAVTGELPVNGFLTTDQDNKNKADAKATELTSQTPKGSESRTWESVDAFVTAFNNSDASGQELRNGFKFDGLADGYRAVFKDGAVKKTSDDTKATLKFTINLSGQTSEEKAVDFTVPITPS
ncbi:lipoprotein 17-related variable surface protein [Mycoplasmopsis columbinasalis]|uniref:Type III secretion system chaperone YscW n=1 Tax=Mycoplasmopsis columbinasalis TaxID=114880 RepID=A0A449B9J6_9BACT|nr:lipoprotein 17-related variable surface protein [Mycoplasmopsis columbinasalis]VEU77835.1 type III secretion system chaperone YscW [Mycoplasmopsis columbinasalis]